jgi:hypothetical protein
LLGDDPPSADVAVFYDFSSMHQKCRGADGEPGPRVLGFADSEAGAVGRLPAEDALFKEALGSLGVLYSHPHTHVWMLTEFPPDYDDPRRYRRSGNVAPYMKRGWCYCEASWAGMVKCSHMCLDLGQARLASDEVEPDWEGILIDCVARRKAPVLPSVLEEELASKHFTNGKDDRPAVAMLNAKGFAERFGAVKHLDYDGLYWAEDEAKAVASVIASGAAPKLRKLELSEDDIGDEGTRALAKALPSAMALKELDLNTCGIGDNGVRALAGVLPSLTAIKDLDLSEYYRIGNEGVLALAKALPSLTALKKLNLGDNKIGDEGARALAKALPKAEALEVLNLPNNRIGKDGLSALQRACKGRTLKLELW